MYIDRDLLENSFLILWLIYIFIIFIEGVRESIQNGIPKLSVNLVKKVLKDIFTLFVIVLAIPTLVIYIILKYIIY